MWVVIENVEDQEMADRLSNAPLTINKKDVIAIIIRCDLMKYNYVSYYTDFKYKLLVWSL